MSETTDIIVQELKELANTKQFQALIMELKMCKLNPFAFKPDGTPEGFAGLIEANRIICDITHLVITTVERNCAGMKVLLTSEEKLEIAAQFLDDRVNLPFWVEPFDKAVFKLLISQAVSQLNKLIGKDWLDRLPAPQPTQ